ncbi:MAG TPA: fibronectin type III domain-containing protein [Verrucomicrobiae bacterium]|nr:fibronectin type III domain-containing protein [Verrucomicrobiae bacterium]
MKCPVPSPLLTPVRTRTALCLIGVLIALLSRKVDADDTFLYAVQISALVQANPPQITLNWEPDIFGANSYTIFRKAKQDTSWGSPIASLPGSATNFTDSQVVVGATYEYQITKAATLGYTGYGYIYTGIQAPMIDQRGTLLLIVAQESTIGLDNELARLQSDLAGDGWQVLRQNVSTNDTPDSVHSLILNDYWANPSSVNTVFLFGHVPILQSGYLDYDGHGPRPMPADAFYGDIYQDWPTTLTNSPSYLPSDVALMVGRVDLFDMPGAASPVPWPSETELLRTYLNKDHAWRQGQVSVPRRALMGNRRGDEGGLAVAASGYRAFEPFVGPGNTIEANISDTAPANQRWMSMLASGGYLWAYGCGAGQDTAISYLGTNGVYYDVWSADIVDQNAQAVFMMVFGSHLGNWDHQDNFMRSVLATPGIGLACCMSGEPHWFMHHMGLGETIGYSTRLSMNNSTLYQNEQNPYTRAVYIALMGDPTLRMEPVPPPSALSASQVPGGIELNWAASPTPGAGYYVYRAPSPAGPFNRLTPALLPGTSFTDTGLLPNTYTYMVRAVSLIANFSGSYYDPSEGLFTTITTTNSSLPIHLGIGTSTNGVVLSWGSQAGGVYHVEATVALNPPAWTNLSGTIEAAGSTMTWTDSTASGRSQRFYRVVSP